jgi:hypothetical protein
MRSSRLLVSCPRNKHVFRCDQNGPPARCEEGAYLNRYVTDEQRSRRPIFIATPWGIVALVAFTLGSADAQTVLHAGPDKVSLVELYTSEGCSSCPPAESWLSALNHDSRLWKTIVPVAFHVDYWDDLGWKDRFSKREYTLRQRSYSISWGTSSVYTPEFIINGKEWKGWFAGETLSDQVEHAAGKLDAKIENGTATVTFSGNSNENALDAHLAPLAMDISSEVRAGENRGRKLSHSFVALDLVTVRMTGNNGIFTAELPLKASGEVAALAVWVTPAGSLKPLQAAGGVIR